eukprot:scaffold17457_cov76-Attheya_sp.AAC.2
MTGGEHAVAHDKDSHTEETGEKGLEGGKDLAGDFAFGFSVGGVEESSVAGIRVNLVFVAGTDQNGSEAKGVAQILNDAGQLGDGQFGTLLGSLIRSTR